MEILKAEKKWSVTGAWNASVFREDREIKPREYLFASEVGGSHIDTILKLRGTIPTNPANERSRRKFFCGNIFEDVLYLVLLRCGLIMEAQKRGEYTYDGLLRVSGRCDFIAGGAIDYEKCKYEIEKMHLSEYMESLSLGVLNKMYEQMGGEELKPMVIECKSVSSMMYERYVKLNAPNPNHVNQIFHYLKSFDMDEGRILYISKDDALLLEFPIFNPSAAEDQYKKEIETITGYYHAKELPPLEKEIFFDELSGKFSKNWKIEYSNFLTMLYGFERPDIYADKVKPVISKWNRVLARIKKVNSGETTKTGKAIALTSKNLEAIEELNQNGYDAYALAAVAEVSDEDEEI